jgi:hypothetical protein
MIGSTNVGRGPSSFWGLLLQQIYWEFYLFYLGCYGQIIENKWLSQWQHYSTASYSWLDQLPQAFHQRMGCNSSEIWNKPCLLPLSYRVGAGWWAMQHQNDGVVSGCKCGYTGLTPWLWLEGLQWIDTAGTRPDCMHCLWQGTGLLQVASGWQIVAWFEADHWGTFDAHSQQRNQVVPVDAISPVPGLQGPCQIERGLWHCTAPRLACQRKGVKMVVLGVCSSYSFLLHVLGTVCSFAQPPTLRKMNQKKDSEWLPPASPPPSCKLKGFCFILCLFFLYYDRVYIVCSYNSVLLYIIKICS